MKKLRKPALIIFLLITCEFGYSQACCSGGTPLSGNLIINPPQAKKLSFTISYENNNMNDLYQGSRDINDRSRQRRTKSILLQSNYSFTDKFSATLLLSYVWQEEENLSSSGMSNFLDANGFGDMIALFQYEFLSFKNNIIIIGVGPKIPTGSTSVYHSDGYLLPADMQPGTGAWDGILFLYHNKSGFLNPNLSLVSNLNYRLTSTAQRFSGQQDYKFGNELQFFSGFSYRVSIKKIIIDPSLMLRFRTTRPDLVNDQPFANTGGNWLFLVPGVTYNITEKLGLGIAGEIPLYRNLTGTQLTTTYKIRASINYVISFDSEPIDL